MAIQQHLRRNVGHPWDGRPGFDALEVTCDTAGEMDRYVREAAKKFWHPWLVGVEEGTGKPGAVFYKPSGAVSEWLDSPDSPHPGA